jgi:hypothetical protein
MNIPALVFHNACPPAAIKDNAAFSCNVLDLALPAWQGVKGILWLLQLGVTDKALAVQKLQEADAKDSATALTAGSTADVHDFTTKASATDDGEIHALYVPMDEARKRYQNLALTAGNGTSGTYLSALAIGIGAGNWNGNAASMGLGNFEQRA